MTRFEGNKINYGKSFLLGENVSLKQKQQAEVEAENILKNAQEQAELLIAETEKMITKIQQEATTLAKTEAEKIKQAAYNEGFEKGTNEGLLKTTEAIKKDITNLDLFAKQSFFLKQRIIKSAYLDITNLIIAISEKVCNVKFNKEKQVLENITIKAINSLPEKEFVTISINPELAHKIYEIIPTLQEHIKGLKKIKIIEDKTISNDGVIVESVDTRLDARISSQINEIAKNLLDDIYATSEEELMNLHNPELN